MARRLTDNDIRLAMLVACGKTNREIAQIKRCAPSTIGNELSELYNKLELTNLGSPRAGLAAWFAEHKKKASIK